LIPKEGIVQEWITSLDVIKTLMGVNIGNNTLLSTSKRLTSPIFNSSEGLGYDEKSTFIPNTSNILYDQNH